MRLSWSALLLATAWVGTVEEPAFAHHALAAQYDLNRSVVVSGTVTKVEWTNPHVRLYLDATGSRENDVMHWQLEMASPNLLVLGGLKIDNWPLQTGATLSCVGIGSSVGNSGLDASESNQQLVLATARQCSGNLSEIQGEGDPVRDVEIGMVKLGCTSPSEFVDGRNPAV